MNGTHRFRQFAALARLTAMEIVRQPIGMLLVYAAALLIALVPLLLLHNFGEEGRLVRDAGLALHFTVGLLFVGQAAASVLARERARGTAAVVLAKPVGPGLFFFGKFAGLAIATLLFSAVAGLATLLADRVSERFVNEHDLVGYVTDWRTGWLLLAAPGLAAWMAGGLNYARRRPFGSDAVILLLCLLVALLAFAGCFDRTGDWAPYDLRVHARLLPASLLVALALLVLAAVALAFAARLGPVPAVTLCLVVFVAGLLARHVLGPPSGAGPAAAVVYAVLPDWQHFWMTDALRNGGSIPVGVVVRAGAYAAAYAGAALCFGAALFRGAENR